MLKQIFAEDFLYMQYISITLKNLFFLLLNRQAWESNFTNSAFFHWEWETWRKSGLWEERKYEPSLLLPLDWRDVLKQVKDSVWPLSKPDLKAKDKGWRVYICILTNLTRSLQGYDIGHFRPMYCMRLKTGSLKYIIVGCKCILLQLIYGGTTRCCRFWQKIKILSCESANKIPSTKIRIKFLNVRVVDLQRNINQWRLRRRGGLIYRNVPRKSSRFLILDNIYYPTLRHCNLASSIKKLYL